jgi:hypothetical protein
MSIKRFFRWYFFIPIALVTVPLFLAAIGEIVKLLWNALLPPLFGWPQITIWQGLGLLVLCRILFGGLGSGGGGGGRRSKNMTPEERERFRRRMRERLCGPSAEGKGLSAE